MSSTSRTRMHLRRLLNELGDLAGEVDPFAPDDSGGLLFPHIATLAGKAEGLARDAVTEEHNAAAENGGSC